MITDIESEAHLFELLPEKCIKACHGSGENYPACLFWVEKLGLNISPDKCIELLARYGAWSLEELKEETVKELNIKLLGVSAGYWEGEE